MQPNQPRTYPERLRSLLDEAGVTPGNIPRIAPLCTEWFLAEPSLATFVLRAIFRELNQDWGEQGVPMKDYAPFEQRLLPQLRELLALILAGDERRLPDTLDRLVRAFHECCFPRP